MPETNAKQEFHHVSEYPAYARRCLCFACRRIMRQALQSVQRVRPMVCGVRIVRFKRITTPVWRNGIVLAVYIEQASEFVPFVILETDGPACRIDYGNLWGG